MMNEAVILAQGLTKSYGFVRALRGGRLDRERTCSLADCLPITNPAGPMKQA